MKPEQEQPNVCNLPTEHFEAKFKEVADDKIRELKELTGDLNITNIVLNSQHKRYFKHDNTVYLEV